jgi:hypothetical protein
MVLDGEATVRRTYSPIGGFLQHRWLDLPPGPHTLTLSAADVADPEAKDERLLFWKAIGLKRL